jgi:hypothetical protein
MAQKFYPKEEAVHKNKTLLTKITLFKRKWEGSNPGPSPKWRFGWQIIKKII